jgi:hypothetical protein
LHSLHLPFVRCITNLQCGVAKRDCPTTGVAVANPSTHSEQVLRSSHRLPEGKRPCASVTGIVSNLKGDSVNYPNTNVHSAPEDSKTTRYVLLVCSLWLRIGAVGAFVLGGVLHQLLTGEMQPLSALALSVGAGVVMVTSWWRARVVLDLDAEADVATATVSSAADPAISGSAA